MLPAIQTTTYRSFSSQHLPPIIKQEVDHMKTLYYKTSWISFLLVGLLCLTGCQLPWGNQPQQINPDSIPDPDAFELPEVQVEVKMPENIEDVDFILGLTINRIGHSTAKDFNYIQEDNVVVAVWGEENLIYGINEDGNQLVNVITGECVMECKGQIGYMVKGTVAPDCMLNIRITQLGQPATCTSSCAEGVALPWYTGVGELILEPLKADFYALKIVVSREEVLGNMHWVGTYKLSSFSGKVNIKGCEFDITLP
jgi:hypothetical protein